MTLLFTVRRQSLTLPKNQQEAIVADSKNYLKVKFNFCTPEWSESNIKYALFTHSGKTYKKILGAEEGMSRNECLVPPEVIKPGKLKISVYCGNLITTNEVIIDIIPSGYTENIENQKTTPSVMEQMNEMMYKYASLCNDIYKECEQIKQKLTGGDE